MLYRIKHMSDLSNAIKQVCEEKGLSYEAVITTIESALAAAYRKDFGQKNQNIQISFDPETAKSKIYDVKTVVEDMPEEVLVEGEESEEEGVLKTGPKEEKTDAEEVAEPEEEVRRFNPKTEIQLSDAKIIKKTAKVDDVIKTKLDTPEGYGRMAAQTAKQVIIQRLREAEREMVFSDFKEKEHEVVSGVVQRREGRMVLVDLGKAIGVLPYDEMIPGETYKPGERIKVYVKEVGLRAKGPEIVLSRTSEEIIKKVFYLEIPEVSNGLIEIKAVAREAGFRSKVAVATDSENVDPIGSCVGQRGARIQTIIHELGGEKVDIINYSDDPRKFIANALSPAKVSSITTNDAERKATVKVAEDQLSLAIGKGGQNARLAAKLTGWKIDIVQDNKEAEAKKEEIVGTETAEGAVADVQSEEKPKKEKKSKKKKTADESGAPDSADKK
jgi:transcription termination/antitermination protein NusA